MKEKFSSQLAKKHPRLAARVMKFQTPHGEVTTPAFMPVGTRAYVNCMNTRELEEVGSQIILGGNTYHMLLSPGMEVLQHLGGMHTLMNWQGPMLTDSGGFQVFSLSKNKKLCKITEQGASFKHPDTGELIHMTPTSSIETQKIIGADIIMAFDECTPEQGGRDAAEAALDRTHRWLIESISAHQAQPNSHYGLPQALFGIIQGGSFRDLREKSAEIIVNSPLDGIAIGGEIIGFDMVQTATIMSWLEPLLPDNKIRYTMGVGLYPEDLIRVVETGVDIFDCVAPTRNARHGSLYVGRVAPQGDWVSFEQDEGASRILIKKSIYAKDDSPIMADCDCYTCQHFSKGYLHFLFKSDSPLYASLATIHNVRRMHQACEVMRAVI